MSRTIILLFHPNFARSRANAALIEAAWSNLDVEIVDMYGCHPGGLDMIRDGEAEAQRLMAAARVVLQFPMQWYSTPALLKSWQDTVLTRMGYIHPATEGAALEGKPLMVATTMGAEEETYRPEGRNGITVPELLAPLRTTALRFAMTWCEPFLLYRANDRSDAELAAAGDRYREALGSFAGVSSAREAA
ncbi:NAD(P)H-dependent oxidoreductase [Caenispirillum bisanense]|uniref:NADPH-quinone reductase (Modulator of drug activity B) n=1 Tax=Caenispirillum bisanense TaxID=414052 RepID=A0A286GSY3_9PROT|nr:NAD(P)H-dependent oxidoreductase [Caenispirillum bisanense]SOD98306.1 Putative NADPH-quinone reductase (modulator of drug activity B) [Caenispirillum bisanense]